MSEIHCVNHSTEYYTVLLTMEFAQRQNMPSMKSPSRGPLIIPNTDKAACGRNSARSKSMSWQISYSKGCCSFYSEHYMICLEQGLRAAGVLGSCPIAHCSAEVYASQHKLYQVCKEKRKMQTSGTLGSESENPRTETTAIVQIKTSCFIHSQIKAAFFKHTWCVKM